jgi:hypothetical protein
MDLNKVDQNIMCELKDFQRATVCRIDELYRNGQNRVLVSDEVGLGKTLVAKGTIAKFAKLRQEEGKNLVKVVYICSNSSIAEQNLEKLRIVNEITTESTDTSRLSMQHLNIFMQEHDETKLNNYVKLIPLTPKTSFNVSNSQGIKGERALMFIILSIIKELKPYRRKLSKLLSFGVNDWKYWVYTYLDKVKLCNKKSNGKYRKFMYQEVEKYLEYTKFNGKSLMECLFDFCDNQNKHDSKEIKDLIVQLRIMFSDISLEMLNPDLIIMDEFQRFKELINGSNEDLNHLSRKLFFTDDVRILMLSATPYKMYSTLDEIDEETDVHYNEFFDVMNFLNKSDEEKDNFKKIWENYSVELKEFNKEDKTSFILAKNKAEKAMFRNVCRTERITETKVANLIEDNDAKKQLIVSKEDITSYINAQKLINDTSLNINVQMDYIKSSPYIMSFMESYQLKKEICRYFKDNPDEIYKMDKSTFWLNKSQIDNYDEIPFNNARLNDLMNHVLKEGYEKLLWIPPSKPYYELGGAFKNHEGFSKTLIFSMWEMVPRMISSLVSYDVERKTIGKLDRTNNDIRYFTKSRYPSHRLNFSLKNEKPSNMALFTLIYPSKCLSNAYDPVDCLNRKLSLEEIESEIKSKLRNELTETRKGVSKKGDPRWYYLAPLFLDLKYHSSFVHSWFSNMERFINKDSKQNILSAHLEYLKGYVSSPNFYLNLGEQPKDLWDVLCDMAIASPAICAYRCYKNYSHNTSKEPLGLFATNFARKFMGHMNKPESISVIDLIFKSNSESSYWKNVLKYSKQGNLQAVFDEYVHMLSCNVDKGRKDLISFINHKLISSLDIVIARYNFDTFEDFNSRIQGHKPKPKKLRTHFAVSFTRGNDDEKDANRRKSVRNAFNSPFRPFVLASTSIGQEGLDFHNYCRRIVHWNIPSNPLELEQREGRINRFKCLAIRQSVAKKYGDIKFNSYDIWDELFEEASRNEKGDGSSDLIPYWGLNDSKNLIKIERIVPMYPFSSDVAKYERVMKILSLYRLTLGQSRQEKLLSEIFKGIGEDYNLDDIKELFINLSPFYKQDIEDFQIDC